MTQPVIDDEESGAEKPGYIGKVKPALLYYGAQAGRKSWTWFGLAIFFALFYAVGTAGLGAVIQFLSTPDITDKPIPPFIWAMLIAFCLRPLFYVLHIQSVSRSVLSLSALPPYSRGVGLMLRSLIILTRDVPTLCILLVAIVVMGKTAGAIIAILLLAALSFVIPARMKAEKGKIARKVKTAGHHTDVIQRRVARTWAEASTDVGIAVLLAVVFASFMFGKVTTFETLASVVILGLLMLTPLRRISRLMVEYK